MSLNTGLTLALPKGRLEKPIRKYLEDRGFIIHFDNRKLVLHDVSGELCIFLVKNTDLPTYVHHGIAGMGICGDDLLYETNYPLYKIMHLPFGSTQLCLAAKEGDKSHHKIMNHARLRVASKFTRFTKNYFHKHDIPVDVIKLNGSVELAAVLELAPYIVDLVETGETLRANKLKIVKKLHTVRVYLVANSAYFKYNYTQIMKFIKRLAMAD